MKGKLLQHKIIAFRIVRNKDNNKLHEDNDRENI